VGRWIKIQLTFKLGRLWKAVLTTILLFLFFWMGKARISVLLPKADRWTW